VAARESGRQIRALPPHTTNGRDAESVDLEAAQRKRARRLGTLLALVVIAIVATTFLWKLSLSQ
jgi:hypothetical protein